MVYKIEEIKLTESMYSLGFSCNLMQDIVNNLAKELVEIRENQIIEVLKKCGYEFGNKQELEHFAKTRCELISFVFNDKKILKVDGTAVCSWWDTYKYENDGNKITVLCGEFFEK